MKDSDIIEIHPLALLFGLFCTFVISLCTGGLLFGIQGAIGGIVFTAIIGLAFIIVLTVNPKIEIKDV